MNATVPLEEALPWSPGIPRRVLVCDSVQTDGRFLLHTMAAQVLLKTGRVLWLGCSPVTDTQVATALKKIGCDAAALYLRDKVKSKNLSIRSLSTEISAKVLDDPQFDAESYLKEVYGQAKTWIQEQEPDNAAGSASLSWVLLDDLSALASIVGEKVVHCFIESLSAFSNRLRHENNSFGLVIRCSHDFDQTLNKIGDEEKDNSGWIGAGGVAQRQMLKEHYQAWIPWERSIESVDAIVDVIPLTSGYSREAHGRLVFSESPTGRGWGNRSKQQTQNAWNKLVINYSFNDNGVRAIRLRA